MKVAFVIDPIETFAIHKDSTYMMLKAGSARNWQQYVVQINDLFIEDGTAYGDVRLFNFNANSGSWYLLDQPQKINLSEFHAIFMRKDPPFDMSYIYATYVLSTAQKEGALVVNDPQALRNINEKVSIVKYPECTPKTLVTKSFKQINDFLACYQDIVVKPLGGMGGDSVFRIQPGDHNKNVILETITQNQERFIMAQQYQPEIEQGDKRILIINGQPLEYLVVRIPQPGDFRGNVARGATTSIRKLTAREYDIAVTVGKDLKAEGVLFAGIDMIGEALTEINITTPTMIQEIYNESGVDAASILMDVVAEKLI